MEQQAEVQASQDQYLTFILDNEEYGVNILTVRSIQGWEQMTPIPNVPSYVKGVINLRGEVVPIIDLRACFGIAAEAYTERTVVIIVKAVQEEKERTVGIIVDAVSEVYDVDSGQLQPPPEMGGTISNDFVQGLTMIEDKMVIVLELDNLISWSLSVKDEEPNFDEAKDIRQ